MEPEDDGVLRVMALWDDEPVDEDEQWSAACAWLANDGEDEPQSRTVGHVNAPQMRQSPMAYGRSDVAASTPDSTLLGAHASINAATEHIHDT